MKNTSVRHSTEIICDDTECKECCPHDEFEHDMCLDCGYERDPGEAIDWAYDRMRDGDL